MASLARVLDPSPVESLRAYVDGGGGRALEAAARLGPAGTVEDLVASGLRGRGGAGFPTGVKWRTVLENRPPSVPVSVVVNAAEGEPGTFKDRPLLRTNPYRVLEGALVAARTVGADQVVMGLKASFQPELERLRSAFAEVRDEGWADGVELFTVEGPGEYLYGEETGLLEVINGRQPFPRIAPPFRHGVDEAGESGATGDLIYAGPEDATAAPPALVNNVETLANVALILAEGPQWFRQVGTDRSPGTIVCTVTGRTRRHGVAEFPLGVPVRQVIEEVGGGAELGHRIVGVLSGVSHPLLPEHLLDTAMTYEDLDAAGAGLGTGGFIVLDDRVDMTAVAASISRFLAVESCGQCTPCKQDGLIMADRLERLRRSEATEDDVHEVERRMGSVSNRARCYLALQHERVIASFMTLFPEAMRQHAQGGRAGHVEPIVPIVDIAEGRAVLDEGHRDKQPDWTYGDTYSGQSPADRFDQHLTERP